MSVRTCLAAWVLAAALRAGVAHGAEPPIPVDAARTVFAQAAASCAADDGRLWGVSLCGPMMLVDRATHAFVANQNDATGTLQDAGGVFTGTLPADRNVANTALDWNGVRWTQLEWPLPEEPAARATLLAHESFHRVQPQLRLPAPREADNAHLDTLDGRYLQQLEWRALAQALEAPVDRAARAAAEDAVRFRAERWRLYPEARTAETALELNEGLAEYTGVVIANSSMDARIAAAVRGLVGHAGDPSYVRSFAYASGPAYGLLLDRFSPGWRARVGGDGPVVLLVSALTMNRAAEGAAQLGRRASRYGGDELLKAEIARDARRREAAQRNRARFVEGPVLVLGFRRMNIQFDPRSVVPLENAGSVYPTLRVTDEWGVLDVTDGALLKPDWSAVVVPAPAGGSKGPRIEGAGFALTLNPGWQLVPSGRAGDWKVDPVPGDAISRSP